MVSQATQQSYTGSLSSGQTADAVAAKTVTFSYDRIGEMSHVTSIIAARRILSEFVFFYA